MSCVEIATIIPTSTWKLDALEVSLAVVFGVIIGVILAIIIARCFVKELAKDRVQRHQDDDVVKYAAYETKVAGYADMTYRKGKSTKVMEKKTTHVIYDEEKEEEEEELMREKGQGDDSEDEGFEEEAEMSSAGIIIALTKASSEKTFVELSLQDFHATKSMEKELLQEREWVFMHLLRIFVAKFVAAEKIDEKYAEDFIQTTSQDLSDAKQSLQGAQLLREEELKKDPGLGKDPILLEEALEQSRLEHIRKMDALVHEVQNNAKDKLKRDSGLSAEEVDAIMRHLLENMANAEKMIGQEQNRQATILGERLSKRQALSEQYGQVTARESKSNQTRVSSLREVANYLAEERELSQSQAESIMKEYKADMEKVQETHKAAVSKQSAELADRLQEHREKRLRALEKKHGEQRDKLAAKATQVVNPSDFVEAHHDLLEQQRNEKNDMVDELDYQEAEELSLLRKTLEEERTQELSRKEEGILEDLAHKAQLNEKEAQRIVKKHSANVKAYDEQLNEEKKRQNALLQEKMNARRAAWEEEQKRTVAEQQQLAEQQERTITKLIDTQSTLDEEAKRQIMLQHEQNVSALNNHLQMTKLKHQKLLEAKLGKRKARFEALRAEQEEERQTGENDEDRAERQKEELAAEERAMREERQAAIATLRQQLARETEEVLKEQDVRMGALIGKLQAGQARRQGVIKKLDKAVKELQDKLVDSIADSNVISERKTERIMATHMQEMEDIEDKLRQARAHQENQLQHKMESIKLMREKTIANDLKQNEMKQPDGRRSSNVGKRTGDALQFMTQILENSRQKQAMKQLEQEMKLETLKQKEELNEQLEGALEQELKERERNFMGQLASLSQLSKEELNDMVQSTIAEEGGNETDAKKLSKDLTKRMKMAKWTDPNADQGRRDDDEEDEEEVDKPKKKKKKGKKGKRANLPDQE